MIECKNRTEMILIVETPGPIPPDFNLQVRERERERNSIVIAMPSNSKPLDFTLWHQNWTNLFRNVMTGWSSWDKKNVPILFGEIIHDDFGVHGQSGMKNQERLRDLWIDMAFTISQTRIIPSPHMDAFACYTPCHMYTLSCTKWLQSVKLMKGTTFTKYRNEKCVITVIILIG